MFNSKLTIFLVLGLFFCFFLPVIFIFIAQPGHWAEKSAHECIPDKVFGCSAYVASSSEARVGPQWVTSTCQHGAVYFTVSVPSETERSDEHFRASLLSRYGLYDVAGHSCCQIFFFQFVFVLSPWDPDLSECKWRSGCVFDKSY